MNPGQYIWHTKHQDLPVTVIRSLGKGPDGKTYVQIEGSNTGIPADQLYPATPPNPRGYSFSHWLKSLLRL